ncbi:hypothetical protein [Aliivibrio fischeri]|uniref:hypothetical protein n=1 Tax=Aliivibrio fischeri TaxID=668 RepID=UPI00080EABD5|nr:hypothetical protein [Aliivibrio fischeri]OCH04989.1 hypothetical protein A6E10_11670 [Aliivibrio fischeri]
MVVFDKLLKPLDYIRIKHAEKAWFDVMLPAILAVVCVAIMYFLPIPVAFIGSESVISLVNGILQILSGFYIASMAAVATFQKEGMDGQMEGVPPKLKIIKKNRITTKSLTRREFLTYLFGYLAFMSILMYFAGGFIQLASGNISMLAAHITPWFKYVLVTLYMFVIFNILCTTILGMHFMIDKIHRPANKVINNKEKEEKTH